jgi:hypothetical protein
VPQLHLNLGGSASGKGLFMPLGGPRESELVKHPSSPMLSGYGLPLTELLESRSTRLPLH